MYGDCKINNFRNLNKKEMLQFVYFYLITVFSNEVNNGKFKIASLKI